MPRTKGKKKKKGASPDAGAQGLAGLDLERAGMPAADSIVEVREMERGGKTYRIIKTNERDAYDEPEGKGRKQ